MLFYACRPDARPFFRLCLHTALSVCHMGVRKWLEKSAEKQKQKLRKTLNPLSRKAFQAVSFSATKDKKRDRTLSCLSFCISAGFYTSTPGDQTHTWSDPHSLSAEDDRHCVLSHVPARNRRSVIKAEKRPAVRGAFPCVELRKREEVGDDEVMFLSVILSTLIGYHIRYGEWMDKF